MKRSALARNKTPMVRGTKPLPMRAKRKVCPRPAPLDRRMPRAFNARFQRGSRTRLRYWGGNFSRADGMHFERGVPL